jgi:hypothetical protein
VGYDVHIFWQHPLSLDNLLLAEVAVHDHGTKVLESRSDACFLLQTGADSEAGEICIVQGEHKRSDPA